MKKYTDDEVTNIIFNLYHDNILRSEAIKMLKKTNNPIPDLLDTCLQLLDQRIIQKAVAMAPNFEKEIRNGYMFTSH